MAKRPKMKFKSPEGVARFPRLNNPDRKYKSEGTYSVQLRIPDEVAVPFIEKIETFMAESMEDVVEKKNRRKAGRTKTAAVVPKKVADKPWHPAFDVVKPDDPEEEPEEVPVPGFHDIRFKLNASFKTKEGEVLHQRPDLIDRRGKTIDPTKQLILGGSVCVVGGFAMPFWADSVGYGVTLRMGAVQVREFATGNSADAYGFDIDEGDEDDLEPSKGNDLEAGDDDDEDFEESE
jgi:hypothetical protein